MNKIIKKGWVARDEDNELWFFNAKPYKEYKYKCWFIECNNYEELDPDLFPEITWKDEEPTEVEIEYTIKKID